MLSEGKIVDGINAGNKSMPDFVLEALMSTFDGKTCEVIAVMFGETGYRTTTWGRQTREWIAEWNERLGIDPATQMAYSLCSLFGNWSNYDNVFQHCQEALNKKAGK